MTEFAADRHEIARAGSADFVLTFRNVHNWMARGEAARFAQAFYAALKPGGVLGVEEHRGPQRPAAGPARQIAATSARTYAIGLPKPPASSSSARPRSTPIRRIRRTIPSASGRCRRPIG